MTEEALHLPFISGLDGGRTHRKRLFTNESEIMDLVNGFTDFDNILLNDMLDADEDCSEDGFSWNEFQDIASDILEGAVDEHWDFVTDSVGDFDDSVLNEIVADSWLPTSFEDVLPVVTEPKAIEDVKPSVVEEWQAPTQEKAKVPTQAQAPPTPVKRTEVKTKTVPLLRKVGVPLRTSLLNPPMHVPRVVTSAELKILGSRSKNKTNPLMKFQTEEPNLRIVERSSNTAVVVKKKSVFRGGQSLLKLSFRAGSSVSSLSSPSSPAKSLSPSPEKLVLPARLKTEETITARPLLSKPIMRPLGKSKPFIEVDHDYCSAQPVSEQLEFETPEMLELMDVESFQHEIVVGEEIEVHDRLPSYYTDFPVSTTKEEPATPVPPPVETVSPLKIKKQAVPMPIKIEKWAEKPTPVPVAEKAPEQKKTDRKKPVETPKSPAKTPEKPVLSAQSSTEKRQKTLLMPPKYQQVSYCEKILQIENDSEDELVDIEGVDESDTFDRLPSYVTSSKAVSPRKSRENKYIDKDEEYTPRKERQRGRKKKDRMNKSTSPAKMKRKLEAELVKPEKHKKRGRPPKSSLEPERKKVKTKEKKKKMRVNKNCSLSESESSDDEGLTRLSKPGAFKAIYSDSDNEENNNKPDLKLSEDEEPDPPCQVKTESNGESASESEIKTEPSPRPRTRNDSWKSSHSYQDLGGTYQDELGFTIFGDFGSSDMSDPSQMADLPDSFPMDEIQMDRVQSDKQLDEIQMDQEVKAEVDDLGCDMSDNQEYAVNENEYEGDFGQYSEDFLGETEIKQESVEFEIVLTGVGGDDGDAYLDGLLNETENHDIGEDVQFGEGFDSCNGEVQDGDESKAIRLRILEQNSVDSEDSPSKSDSTKRLKRKLTLSDYLIRKEYEKNICSGVSGDVSPSQKDIEEGEIEDMTEANLEEAAKQLSAISQEVEQSEDSDFYKKVKDSKRKRDESCSSSSSSSSSCDSESSGSSSDSDDLRSRSPSPFLKSRRKSRTSMRYSTSRSRRRGSYSTDSTSSESESRSRSRSSSSHGRRRSRRSYSSCSDCSASSYDVKSKSRRKDRSKSRPQEERKVIHVAGLPKFLNEKELYRKFQKFGPIKEVKIKQKTDGSPYGFVTFYHGSDAVDAMEHGNDDVTKPRFEISFGGRRKFCRENYADLDSRADARFASKPVDFDALLRETKEKLTKRC